MTSVETRAAGAFLAGAFLAGAFLAGVFLAGAVLAGAYRAGAFLADVVPGALDCLRVARSAMGRAYWAATTGRRRCTGMEWAAEWAVPMEELNTGALGG